MKNILLIFLFSISSHIFFGQGSEVKRQMSLGVQSGILVDIPNVDEKFISKMWKKYCKDFGRLERNRKAEENYITDAKIISIRSDNMDVYSRIRDNEITVFFDIKDGFLNSADNPKEFDAALNFMTEFGYEVQREKVKEELEVESNKLKKSMKGLEKLKKDNNSYHKAIDEAKAKIRRAEDNIITNTKDQIKAEGEIQSQTKIVESVQNKLNNIGKSK
ncbi:MAG: hypothetical protein ABIO44_08650 [Saprospiraceae bacterium]